MNVQNQSILKYSNWSKHTVIDSYSVCCKTENPVHFLNAKIAAIPEGNLKIFIIFSFKVIILFSIYYSFHIEKLVKLLNVRILQRFFLLHFLAFPPSESMFYMTQTKSKVISSLACFFVCYCCRT